MRPLGLSSSSVKNKLRIAVMLGAKPLLAHEQVHVHQRLRSMARAIHCSCAALPAFVTLQTRLLRHERKHLEQIERDGRAVSVIKYSWRTICHGYRMNPYEVEARAA